mmetsp:Transcript_19649/g.22330  ORF Transcript_19649/g.22330 Transcript_19649/m.22330 type:complete len:84 (-) Transcript_19649:105-356(-)
MLQQKSCLGLTVFQKAMDERPIPKFVKLILSRKFTVIKICERKFPLNLQIANKLISGTWLEANPTVRDSTSIANIPAKVALCI